MNRLRKCIVQGCKSPQHAKGYCRSHYGQQWRSGRNTPLYVAQAKRPVDNTETVKRSLENKLAECQANYDVTVGVTQRIYWRKKMTEARELLDQLSK